MPAAGDDRGQAGVGARALQHRRDRRTRVKFHHAGVQHGARDGHQAARGRVAPGGQGKTRERLNVAEHHSGLSHRRRLAHRDRQCRSALQAGDDCGCLTGDERVGAGADADLHTTVMPFGDRALHGGNHGCAAAGDAHDHPAAAQCASACHRAVQHEVGHMREKDRVLAAGGLTLGTVDHDGAGLDRAHGCQFSCGREARTACAHKFHPLGGCDQVLKPGLGQQPPHLLVLSQGEGAPGGGVGQQQGARADEPVGGRGGRRACHGNAWQQRCGTGVEGHASTSSISGRGLLPTGPRGPIRRRTMAAATSAALTAAKPIVTGVPRSVPMVRVCSHTSAYIG